MANDDQTPPQPFWQEVKTQVAAGTILLGVAGIFYICWTVPRQIDLVLKNQEAILGRQLAAEERIAKMEDSLNGLDRRVTRLEVK